MSAELHDLHRIVGEISGTLKTHIAAVDRDRAEADIDRRDNADYRNEVRTSLASLSIKVAAIDPLAQRIDAVDSEDNPASIKRRLAKIEPLVDDLVRKAAAAVAIITGAITLIAYVLNTFGADIKAFALRFLRVS